MADLEVCVNANYVFFKELLFRKVRQARKHGIPIVVQEWLKCCIYQWENVDKEPFSLYKDDQPSSSSNDTKLSSSHRAQALSSAHQNHASSSSVAGSSSSGGGSGIGDGGIGLAQIPTIARESLRRMSNEVVYFIKLYWVDLLISS